MENKSEGMDKLESLIKWNKRKQTVKSLLRGGTSFLFIGILAFLLMFSLEKGIANIIPFLRSLFLQFTLVKGLSFILTILGYFTLFFLVVSVILTCLTWYVNKKVEEIEGDEIVISY